jgi:3-hydroxyisobutyrate dehydrogenase-like beta-hydroxyacid dehydrogenase
VAVPVRRVGFVGLGDIGRPMAQRIVDAGFDVTLYARRPDTLAPFRGQVRIAASMAELAAGCEVLGVCVYGDADVQEVLTGDLGALSGAAPGLIVLIHSTIHPSTCVDLARQASEVGVSVLDAPISGASTGAAAGELVAMVGGDAAILELARPVLAAFSREILHLGPVGTGQIAKLLNNLVFASQTGIVCDALELASRLGLRDDALIDVLQQASGGSRAATAFRTYAPFEKLLDICRPLVKDVGLVRELAATTGGVPESLSTAAERFVRLL